MTDLAEHPYLVLCDRARCAPDSRHIAGHDFQWLADRFERETGETVTAEQVEAWEDDFYGRR